MIAIDTNVFVGAIQTFNPDLRAAARRSVKVLLRRGEELVCFPQNLVEFWNVSTRPASANGLGLTPEQAARYVDRFQTIFRLLPETTEIFSVWRSLALKYRISGIHVHDARIVAAMAAHRVESILTFDQNDFKRYDHIVVLAPKSL